MSHTHYSKIWIVCGVRATHHRAVAEGREEEDEMALSMRRIVSIVAVAALMAAMLAAMAVPAFAEIACTWEQDYWTGEQYWVCYDYGY